MPALSRNTFHLKNQTLQTVGLGAQISAATDSGQFQILLLATIVMALMVVTINRLVWRPLYRLAETRYKLGAEASYCGLGGGVV